MFNFHVNLFFRNATIRDFLLLPFKPLLQEEKICLKLASASRDGFHWNSLYFSSTHFRCESKYMVYLSEPFSQRWSEKVEAKSPWYTLQRFLKPVSQRRFENVSASMKQGICDGAWLKTCNLPTLWNDKYDYTWLFIHTFINTCNYLVFIGFRFGRYLLLFRNFTDNISFDSSSAVGDPFL